MKAPLLFAVLLLVIPGVLEADWMSSDVPVGLLPPGVALEDPLGTWTIEGAGTDIWGTSDECHFLFDEDPVSGDFAVSCRVVSFGDTPNPWGKAGIMARTGFPDFLGPESYAYCCATINNGACLQWRDGDGGNAAWDGAGVNQWMVGPNDVWLKLVRQGDTFSGYAALERPLWVSLNDHFFANLFAGDELYVGIAVTSHEPGVLARAVVDEIDIEDPGISDAGPSALTCQSDGERVTLAWTNNASYDALRLFRRGLSGVFTEVTPGPEAGAETFTDAPGDGIWEYWLGAVDRGVECVAVSCSSVAVGDLGYAGEVLVDSPFAYWRLGEEDGFTAFALGSAGPAVDGTYVGGVTLDQESLLPSGEDRCALFDGLSGEVTIPDSNEINTGGPYDARTIELWFEAEFTGMLFEEGGATRGLAVYVIIAGNQLRLVMNGWNQAEQSWGPISVQTPIEEGEVYHAVMVFESSDDGTFGDFDGRITGYLNGEEFETATGADRLFAHGNDTAIGGINQNVRLHDNSTMSDGGNFLGYIDEVALYAFALDDPDGDGDRSDSRVEAHYRAASTETVVTFQRGDPDASDSINLTDAVFILNHLFLGGPAPGCADGADADDSGAMNLSDAVYTLNYLFRGGSAPPPPTGACGSDPTDDTLDCASYPPCG